MRAPGAPRRLWTGRSPGGGDPELAARALLDGTPDAAITLDRTGHVVAWNTAADRLLDLEATGAAGRPCCHVLACRDATGRPVDPAVCPLLTSIQAELPPPTVETRVGGPGGAPLRISAQAILLPGRANPRALVLVRPSPAGLITGETRGALASAAAGGAGAPPDSSWQLDFDGILDRLLSATGADAAELYLTAPVSGQVVLAAHRGDAPRAFRQITQFERGDGFPGLVVASGSPLVSADLRHDPRYRRTAVQRQGFHQYLCVPVPGEREILGSLNIAGRPRSPAVTASHAFLIEVGRELGSALELARYRAAEPIAQHVPDAGRDAGASFREVVERSLARLVEVAEADYGVLFLRDGTTGRLAPGAEAGVSPKLHRLLARQGGPVACPVLDRCRCQIRANLGQGEPAFCTRVRREATATLCLPLGVDAQSVGVALLGYQHRAPEFTACVSFLHRLLPAVATAISHAQLTLGEARRARGEPPVPERAAGTARRAPPESGLAVPAPFLDLRCLGRLLIFRDGQAVAPEGFARLRSLTVLKILLTRYGRPVHREELLEFLAPEAEPRSAGRLLNVAVHYLRHGLEPASPPHQPSAFIRRRGDHYWFDTESPHRLDSREFLDLADAGAGHDAAQHADAAIEAYQRAIALYTGDLLEDEPYSDWCALEREYLRERLLTLLRRSADLYRTRGDRDAAIGCYRRALTIEPALEDIHRALMETLWQGGQRDAALRQYRGCRAILARALGVAPMPETETLRQRISAEAPDHC